MSLLAALLLMLVIAGAIGTVSGFGPGATIFSLVILVGGGLGLIAIITWWIYGNIFGDNRHTHWSHRRLMKAEQSKKYEKGVIEETTYPDH